MHIVVCVRGGSKERAPHLLQVFRVAREDIQPRRCCAAVAGKVVRRRYVLYDLLLHALGDCALLRVSWFTVLTHARRASASP